MKKIIKITFVVLLSSFTILAQTNQTKIADTYFENLAYYAAADAYDELAKENPTEHMF